MKPQDLLRSWGTVLKNVKFTIERNYVDLLYSMLNCTRDMNVTWSRDFLKAYNICKGTLSSQEQPLAQTCRSISEKGESCIENEFLVVMDYLATCFVVCCSQWHTSISLHRKQLVKTRSEIVTDIEEKMSFGKAVLSERMLEGNQTLFANLMSKVGIKKHIEFEMRLVYTLTAFGVKNDFELFDLLPAQFSY